MKFFTALLTALALCTATTALADDVNIPTTAETPFDLTKEVITSRDSHEHFTANGVEWMYDDEQIVFTLQNQQDAKKLQPGDQVELVNPEFSNGMTGWTHPNGNFSTWASATVNDTIGYWNGSQPYSIYQSVTDLPKGLYLVQMNGFDQAKAVNASDYSVIEQWLAEGNIAETYLFANDQEVLMKNVLDDALTGQNIYRWYNGVTTNDSYFTDEAATRYMPKYNEHAWNIALSHHPQLYLNSVVCAVTDDDGTLTFGWRKTDKDRQAPVVFDHFRVTYLSSDVTKLQQYANEYKPLTGEALNKVIDQRDEQQRQAYQMLSLAVEQPGTLGDEIFGALGTDFNLADLKRIKISGQLNDADLVNLRDRCTGLLEIDLSQMLNTTLIESQFRNHYQLRYVELPDYLESLPANSFQNCYNLRRAVLPEGLVTLGSSAYQGAGLQQLVLPPTLLAIPFAAFRNNYELTDVQFNGQTTLGKSYTFSNCTHLKTLSLPATMQSIGDYAFESCTRLEDVRLNEGLTEILDNAFIKCRSLRQLTLPSSVQGLYKSPFEQCDSLMHLTSLAVAPPYCLGTAASGYAHYNPFGSSRVPRTVSVPYISEGVYKQTYGWDQHNIVTHPDLPKNVYINQDYNLTWPADLMASWKPNIHLTPTAKNVQSYYDYVTIGSLYVGSKASLSADTLTTYYGFHVAKEADNRRFFTPMLVNGTARADIIVTEMNVPQDFWTFFSLPYDVKVADITRSHPDDPFVIRTYDGQKRAEGKNTEAWVNMTADSTLHAGQGYIIRTANGDYYQHYNNFFLPSVNNGNKTRYFTNADVVIDLKEYPTEFAHNRSWNFLGNPYPCFFDIRAMQTTSPVTVWSRSGRYETYSPLDDDFILNPGQAFFVQRPLEQSQLIFLKEGRQQNLTIRDTIYYNSSRARMAGQQRQVFNLLLFDGGNPSAQADRTRLVVNEAASRSYEPGLDASKFFSIEAGAAHLYTLCDGVQYAINERPLADGLVQLGLQVSREGTYTISLAQQLLSLVGEGPGLRSVTLIDQQEHTETDLTTQDYTFQAASGTSNQRFLIRLDGSTSGITETTAGKPVNSTYYDLQGRPVSQPQQGIYVKDGQKVIIK